MRARIMLSASTTALRPRLLSFPGPDAPNSAYAGLVLYTPLGAKPGCGPEEFIGYTPVPETSLMLLGTGLLARDGDLMKLFEFKLTHSQDAPATLADVKTRCGRFRAALN